MSVLVWSYNSFWGGKVELSFYHLRWTRGYVCSSLSSTDVGFIVVIDRRQDRWAAVKGTLLRIAVSVFLAMTLCIVYVLRGSCTLSQRNIFVKPRAKISLTFFPSYVIKLHPWTLSHHCLPCVSLTTEVNRTSAFWGRDPHAISNFDGSGAVSQCRRL